MTEKLRFAIVGAGVIAPTHTEDCAVTILRFANGALGDYGSNTKKSNATKPSGAMSNPVALSVQSHALQFADMLRAIRDNGTPLVDGHEGRKAVEIILGIYESARTGKEVQFT